MRDFYIKFIMAGVCTIAILLPIAYYYNTLNEFTIAGCIAIPFMYYVLKKQYIKKHRNPEVIV